MNESRPERWTDEEMRAYLLAGFGSPEGWRVWRAAYGHIGEDGVLRACADDWDERAQRVTDYLRKIGAPAMLDLPNS